MEKIMILTDSTANPRSFPPSEVVTLEETYPYLLRAHFKDPVYWQLSLGDATTLKILHQPMGYLNHWNPDIIIVHAGIPDCRPEAFSDFQKEIIGKITWPLFRRVKKYVYNPAFIRRRQIYRVPKNKFEAVIKKFKMVFPKAKIFWLEIGVGIGYEKFRPGVNQRVDEYNAMIRQVYQEGFISIQQRLLEVDGYNSKDFEHWNKRAHRAVAEILISKIEAFDQSVKQTR